MPSSRASSASRAASRSTGAPEAMRSDEAVPRSSSASSSSAVSTFSPMPITAHPSWGRASISTPETFRPSTHTSFGHLIRHFTGATASHASRDGDRDRQRQRLECRRREPHEHGEGQGPARGRRPRAALPAASRGLPLGGHHRSVWRSGERQVARAVVGRPDEVQMNERAPERSRARPRPQRVHGDSVSGDPPATASAAAALPPFIATAIQPEESSYTTSSPDAHVGERPAAGGLEPAGHLHARSAAGGRRSPCPAPGPAAARSRTGRRDAPPLAGSPRPPREPPLRDAQVPGARSPCRRPPARRRARGGPPPERTRPGRERWPRPDRGRTGLRSRPPPSRLLRLPVPRATAGRCRGRPARFRCGTATRPPRRVLPTPGSTTANTIPWGRNGSAFSSTNAACRTSVGGRSCAMSITVAPGAMRSITPWQTPTHSSRCP